ncbi:hypothetical protein [Dactylosporangium sp. CS-033363]|uniref:hypothetical protein n=1 Tax=Dactylosporangium sp. CS-033363 TaxID=3239935 RepID=UPI003D92F6ED
MTVHAVQRLIGERAVGEPKTATHGDISVLVGGTGVYVAESVSDTILYVGSVHRPRDPHGIRSRMREHFRRTGRRQRWVRITFFPIDADIPHGEILSIEGRLSILLAPAEGRAWPHVRPAGEQ